MAQPIILINSWPGVGKHTIAKELEKMMNGKARLIHNHLNIDLAGAMLPRTSPSYLPLRHALRSALLTTLATSPDTFPFTYIFTDFQTTNEAGTSTSNKYAEAARKRGCTFISVVLDCQAAENERRMCSPERTELVAGGKGMLLDTNVLKGFRKKGEIYRFKCAEELELDVTVLTALEAAERILAHVQAVGRDADWGSP